MTSRLTALQTRILELLAPVTPRWTLTGGAALAGFHLRHRTTRDLDLFWHGRESLEQEVEDSIARLRDAGLAVDVLQRSRAFVRVQARDAREQVIVDLVAEPVATIESPVEGKAGEATIQLDSAHEILVNKLGSLLHRTELRDLVDVQALLARGGDLARAAADAARKDSGFSPVTLGWTLQAFPVHKQADIAGLAPAEAAALERFRSELAERIAQLVRP